MISLEDFGELFMRVVAGQASEIMTAMAEGRPPEAAPPEAFASTLWTVCQPDVTVVKLDITDRVKVLPGSDNAISFQVYFAYRTETRELLFLYLDGHNTKPTKPPAGFDDHLTEMIRPLLLDEYELEPNRVNEMLAEEGVVQGLDHAFTETVSAEAQAKIDVEVAKWREEIDNKIDSLFKSGGGETP